MYARYLREQHIPIFTQRIRRGECNGCHIQHLIFADGTKLPVTALFTTRGDIYHNKLAKKLVGRCVRGGVRVYLGPARKVGA